MRPKLFHSQSLETLVFAWLKLWGCLVCMAIAACAPISIAEQHRSTPMVESCTYNVVASYPHDPTAFTQGLIYFERSLYEGTGLFGGSSIREVNLETGKILRKVALASRYFGEGITIWDDKLIQLTWKSRKGFVYDVRTFERLRTFEYPTEGWGLTHDGTHLIMSDGSDALYILDPETFATIKTILVREGDRPIQKLNELEYIHGEIYANVWFSDRIARISPQTGQVLGWIDLTGLYDARNSRDAVLNGIAYDAERDRLFVTGKLWSRLFEVELACQRP